MRMCMDLRGGAAVIIPFHLVLRAALSAPSRPFCPVPILCWPSLLLLFPSACMPRRGCSWSHAPRRVHLGGGLGEAPPRGARWKPTDVHVGGASFGLGSPRVAAYVLCQFASRHSVLLLVLCIVSCQVCVDSWNSREALYTWRGMFPPVVAALQMGGRMASRTCA